MQIYDTTTLLRGLWEFFCIFYFEGLVYFFVFLYRMVKLFAAHSAQLYVKYFSYSIHASIDGNSGTYAQSSPSQDALVSV
jgi:hypothetical protein